MLFRSVHSVMPILFVLLFLTAGSRLRYFLVCSCSLLLAMSPKAYNAQVQERRVLNGSLPSIKLHWDILWLYAIFV